MQNRPIHYTQSGTTILTIDGFKFYLPFQGFNSIKVNTYHSSGLDKFGKLRMWGRNIYGNLGILSNSTISPVVISGKNKTFCEISNGTYSSFGIDFMGRAWGWGWNYYGTLGDNSNINKSTPVLILGATKTFCKISGGNTEFALGIDKNGKMWSWGKNINYALGINSLNINERRSTPVAVYGTKTFCKVEISPTILSIDKNGRVWSWGLNSNGQIGDNTVLNRETPKSIGGSLKTFCEIYTNSSFHSIGLDKNGKMWSWGYNAYGQLGDNTIVNRSTPVAVYGTKTFCKITNTFYISSAIDKYGMAWVWGRGVDGQFGNNTNNQYKSTPVVVYGNHTFCDIKGGDSHLIAIDNHSKAWGWGYNSYGQVGIGSLTTKSTPTALNI